jgi:hypothetical protein
MPLPVPSLDDTTFDDLVAEGHALIPRAFPGWTDHNQSDPGVTLLELFAFLVESLIYRADRVPDATLANLARLVGVRPLPGQSAGDLLAAAAAVVARPTAAVTAADTESLLRTGLLAIDPALPDDLPGGTPVGWTRPGVTPGRLVAATPAGSTAIGVLPPPAGWPDPAPAGPLRLLGPGGPLDVTASPAVARARVVPAAGPDDPVRAVLVPVGGDGPAAALLEQAYRLLRSRTLLATRVRAIGPAYRSVSIHVTVVRDVGTLLRGDAVEAAVRSALTGYLSPLTGGDAGQGWEFGRPLYRSELYGLLEAVPGVDHVATLLLDGDPVLPALPLDGAPATAAVSLVSLDDLAVTVLDAGSAAAP